MEILIFLKDFIRDTQSLFILWALTLAYLLYSSPQLLRFDIYGSFFIGFYILCIGSAVYPFLALSQEHYWWYGLCFMIPLAIVFVWSCLMFEYNSYNGEAGLTMLIPPFVLLFCIGISMVIRLVRHLLA